MRLILNVTPATKTAAAVTKSFAARVHDKKPSYFDEATKSLTVTIDGAKQKLVLHPKRESSNRVNFAAAKPNTWMFVDSDELHKIVREGGNLVFTTAEGRAAKVEVKAEAEAEGAKAPATKTPVAPAYQPPMGAAKVQPVATK